MKIILAGGGTMGSVTPLLALAEELKKCVPGAEFLWIGTKNGPEKRVVDSYNINFKTIPAGKLRRYFSLQNFSDPFLILAGFLKSLWLIFKFKPRMILSAGGFVAVPVIWAGWVLHVQSLIHQQDIRPGLANKLTARVAKIITVAFPESLQYFPRGVVTGNPVRPEIFSGSREAAEKFFDLEKDLPTLLILGGGTGALGLNKLIAEDLSQLTEFCQIIHMTGGKIETRVENPRYHPVDFFVNNYFDVIVTADLVVSRAGMGTLTELAVLGKPTVVIPISGSHQEDNAYYFKKQNAVVLWNEKDLTPENFSAGIRELFTDKVQLEDLSRNIRGTMPADAAEKMVEEILKVIKK